MESRLPKEIAVARLRLAKDHPYLSAALWSMIPVYEPKCPTMAVDQYWRLYFGDSYNQWSSEEISAVLYHEVLHLMRDHHDRARMNNAHTMPWNVAADAEINDDLRNEGLNLPEGCVYPEKIIHKDTKKPMEEGLLSEQYYAGLDIQEVECSCPSGGQGDGDGEGGDSSGTGQDGNEQSEGGGSSCGHGHDQSPGQSGSSGKDGQEGGNCPVHDQNGIPNGSASSNQSAPWEKAESEGRTVSKAESEIVRRKVAQDAVDHAKNRGNVPGFMERWASEKLNPQVPWQQVLKGTIRRIVADVSGAVDYVRTRPARRQSATPQIVLPALRKPTPSIAMGIDTSGSMSDRELAAGRAEVEGVLKSLGVRELRVFTVDAELHGGIQRVQNASKIKMQGGGGTDMGLCIKAAEQMRPKPDALIVFTDGYTPWPSKGPQDFKVVVVSTSEQEGPAWAKTVHVKV